MEKKNLRNTALRSAILAIFHKQRSPISIAELAEMLAKQGFLPNKTTLYRQMQTLTTTGRLHQVALASGAMHYELASDHHHHFVCTDCHQTLCVEDPDLEKQIASLEQKLSRHGIKVQEHHFSFAGLCKACH